MPSLAQGAAGLDIKRILEILESHQVDYVLIGGLAARIHGSPLLTEDIDITPAAAPANLGRLAAALGEMEAKLRVPGIAKGIDFDFDETSFGAFTTMAVTTRFGYLDVCLRPDGTGGYPDLVRDAIRYEVFGLEIKAASLAAIIRSKTAAGREKDLAALSTLHGLSDRLRRDSS